MAQNPYLDELLRLLYAPQPMMPVPWASPPLAAPEMPIHQIVGSPVGQAMSMMAGQRPVMPKQQPPKRPSHSLGPKTTAQMSPPLRMPRAPLPSLGTKTAANATPPLRLPKPTTTRLGDAPSHSFRGAKTAADATPPLRLPTKPPKGAGRVSYR